MKNRNSSPLHTLPPKYSDSELKRPSERAKRNKSASNTFLQKGARFLQTYTSLLTKNIYQGGDPDQYFRQTLRNYDDLDFFLIKNEAQASLKQGLKSVKSVEHLKLERRRSASYIGSGDNRDSFRESQRSGRRAGPRRSKTFQSTHRTDDEDAETFYSPTSQLTARSPVAKRSRNSRPSSSKPRTHHTEEDDQDLFYSPASQVSGRSSQNKVKMADPENVPEEEAEGGQGEDPLQETEALVKQAEDDLDKLDETLIGEGEGEALTEPTTTAGGGDTTEPGDTTEEEPTTQNADEQGILREVAECEAQCTEISKILVELRQKVTQLLSKPSRSPEEDRELEKNQKELNDKMMLLEQKTKKVEYLMTLSRKRQVYDQPQTEDVLPKVIICGVTDNNMPKIIVCDDKKKKKRDKIAPHLTGAPECDCKDPKSISISGPTCGPCPMSNVPPTCPASMAPMQQLGQMASLGPMAQLGPLGGMQQMPCGGPPPNPMGSAMGGVCPMSGGGGGGPPPSPHNMMPAFAQRLCESYNMQEKLAAENADLEGKRYQLQSDLLNKDQTVESLQRKLASLQAEMRMVCKENSLLTDKLETAKV